MDKNQKQLLDTYFRKREIATGDYDYGYAESVSGIQPYELLYMIKNHLVVEKKVSTSNVASLIKYDPELYTDKDIQPYLYKLTLGAKSNIVQYRPEFLDVFGEDVSNQFKGDSISLILQRQPQLLDRFDIEKMSNTDVRRLITRQPQLITIPFFENEIKNLNSLGRTMFWSDFMGYQFRSEKDEKIQHKKFINAIVKYPQFRDIFRNELREESFSALEFLQADYTLLPYLDLGNLHEYALGRFLSEFPKLINKFSAEQLNTVQSFWRERLLDNHPELKPYFNKASNNG